MTKVVTVRELQPGDVIVGGKVVAEVLPKFPTKFDEVMIVFEDGTQDSSGIMGSTLIRIEE